MARMFWKIVGYQSSQIIFEDTLPMGALSEAAMKILLQRLAARHLSAQEVVASSLKLNNKGYSGALEVQRSHGDTYALMTTDSLYYYVATVQEG